MSDERAHPLYPALVARYRLARRAWRRRRPEVVRRDQVDVVWDERAWCERMIVCHRRGEEVYRWGGTNLVAWHERLGGVEGRDGTPGAYPPVTPALAARCWADAAPQEGKEASHERP